MKDREELTTIYQEDEIDLYELWLTLKKRKLTVIITTVIFFIIAAAYAFLAKPVYKTDTVLVPLGGKEGSFSSLLSSLPIPIQTNSNGITVELVLKSRTLKEDLIKQLNLMPLLFPNKWDSSRKTWKDEKDKPTLLDGVKKLDDLMSVSSDKKTGAITFSVMFPEKPQIAYEIAKKSLNIASKILNEKSAKLAHQYTLYIKAQLDKAKKKYKLLEKVYQDFLKGKIKNVPFIFDERDVALLKKLNKHTNLPSTFVNLPQYKFNMEKLKLQMEIASQLLTTLTQQYELAKAQEQKEKVSFQVVDPPYVPPVNKPYKPKKALIISVGFTSGLFLGIFLAFFKEWIENVKKRGLKYEEDN
ncbi:Wzz/FepE/Etk N-terminal domain-containing protein [Thermovibrio sp.]